ncbi:MAG: hypothetical protein LKM37_09110 [Bacteroidales bacterium]|jgi:hypothetical protein|nr:hypothetical protein [Bacteroidales bacterium]
MKKVIRNTIAIVICALASVNILSAGQVIKNDKIMKSTDNKINRDIKINRDKKVWAWMGSVGPMSDAAADSVFAKAKEAGIDALIMEVHGGNPVGMADTTDFTDYAAIAATKKAAALAKKYGIELHIWMWIMNRCEKNLQAAHRDWYQVNAEGKSCLDYNMYGVDHYRWLCPSQPQVLEYLKARVSEIAEIDGVAGINLDFIRYPDAILPAGLWELRKVHQDKVYPRWDHCYCPYCREQYKKERGIDPIDIQNPTEDKHWMEFRYKAVVKIANALADVIHKHDKIASADVFPSPDVARKLVRQDWTKFTHLDIVFPMIYYQFYNEQAEWIITETKEGVKGLKKSGSNAYLCSGIYADEESAPYLSTIFDYVRGAGSDGISIYDLGSAIKTPGYWEALKAAIIKFKE